MKDNIPTKTAKYIFWGCLTGLLITGLLINTIETILIFMSIGVAVSGLVLFINWVEESDEK